MRTEQEGTSGGREGGARSLPVSPGGKPVGSRFPTVLAASFFLLFVVAADGRLAQKELPPGGKISAGGTRNTKKVRLGGHATKLYPGRVEPLRVHADNLSPQPQVVRSAWAVVGDAARCAARNVSVTAFHGRLRIPPKGRRWISLTIAMRSDAANACQHAVFPLTFQAEVRR